MKKVFIILTAAITLFSGCSKIGIRKEESSEESVSQTEVTEPATEAVAEARKYEPKKGSHIFDEAGALSPADFERLEDVAKEFKTTYKSKIAIFVADDIGDLSPKEYAEKCFQAENGDITVLINNDTGKDVILPAGYRSKFITGSEIDMILAQASPMLVTGDYAEGIEMILEKMGEKLPRHAIDETGKLKVDEIRSIEEKLEASEFDLTVFYVSGYDDDSYNKKYRVISETLFSHAPQSAAFVVRTDVGKASVILAQNTEIDLSVAERSPDISECLTENGFDYVRAAEYFINITEK